MNKKVNEKKMTIAEVSKKQGKETVEARKKLL